MIVQPHVDFGLKLLGADAMAIPGLYGFVQVPVLTFCMVKHGLNLFLHDLCPCNQYVLFFMHFLVSIFAVSVSLIQNVRCIYSFRHGTSFSVSFSCCSFLTSVIGNYVLFPQELIKEQVANMYLWPKYLEVTIMDPKL